MKKIIVLLILFSFIGIAEAIDFDLFTGQLYGGYTVIFNGENHEGLVFFNRERNSALVIVYPSWNKCFIYTASGAAELNYNTMRDYLIINFGAVLDSTVSRIIKVK